MGRLILTYHMTRVDEWSRNGADLLALRADLEWLASNAIPVCSLEALFDPACEHGVALTFDDGTRMDAESIDHPDHGQLPSAISILAEFKSRLPGLCVANFVIASPVARNDLAAALTERYGADLMHERWWKTAASSGLMQLENHSWDHNHPLVQRTAQRDNLRGSFFPIETEAEAEAEIADASTYIESACGRRPRYFAYPFGEASEFLRSDYLPRRGIDLGLVGAFSTEPRALRADDDRWYLPRFVSGRDWRSNRDLERLVGAWL